MDQIHLRNVMINTQIPDNTTNGGFLFIYGTKVDIFYACAPVILPVPLTGVMKSAFP